MEKAVLVYQAGLANVFEVDCFNMRASGRTERRLLQDDFRTCEAFARGLASAGVLVATAACNQAGDIARADWSSELMEQPFSDKFRPVWNGVNPDIYFTMRTETDPEPEPGWSDHITTQEGMGL